MAEYAALITCHQPLLFFRRTFLPRAVTIETILKIEFFMHLHHLGVFAMAYITAEGIGLTEICYYHEKQCT